MARRKKEAPKTELGKALHRCEHKVRKCEAEIKAENYRHSQEIRNLNRHLVTAVFMRDILKDAQQELNPEEIIEIDEHGNVVAGDASGIVRDP